MNAWARTTLWMTVFGWGILTSLVVFLETRSPGTDIFLFKEAGANLALKGKFVASNINNLPPDTELLYAYYPPVYSYAFGVWSSLCGLGVKQSLLFDSLIRGLRTLLLVLLVFPSLRRALEVKSRTTWLIPVVLLLFSLVSSDNDRPDELALVLGLLSWLLIEKETLWRLSGPFLGLTAATSPTAALFFATGITLKCAVPNFMAWRLTATAFTSLAVFVGCVAPVLLSDNEAYARFSNQTSISTFPYALPFRDGGLLDFYYSFSKALSRSLQIGWRFIWCIGFLTLLLFFDRKSWLKRRGPSWRPEAWLGLFFVPVSLVVWSLQPYYLWFSCVVLMGVAIRLWNGQRMLPNLALSVVALLPLVFTEMKSGLNALERLSTLPLDSIRAKVLSHVGPSDRMAVSHDQFFTFRSYREVADISFVCPYLERFEFVYTTRVLSSRRTVGESIPIPCEKRQACFSAVADVTSKKVFHIFGWETPYYVRDYGGVLYRRTSCHEPKLR